MLATPGATCRHRREDGLLRCLGWVLLLRSFVRRGDRGIHTLPKKMSMRVSRCPWTFHTGLRVPGKYRTRRAEDRQREVTNWNSTYYPIYRKPGPPKDCAIDRFVVIRRGCDICFLRSHVHGRLHHNDVEEGAALQAYKSSADGSRYDRTCVSPTRQREIITLMMPPQLPNELVDEIISSIAVMPWLSPEERHTLRNCALVCRDWLPASRHALFSDVELIGPAAWDSFRLWVADAEEGQPWLSSIHHLTFKDQRCGRRSKGEEAVSEWRGQYVVPVLAGRLPNLEYLSLTVDWARCQPHPATFGMFVQFTSLRVLRFIGCQFPSFGAFRRVLASLPALKDLTCMEIHWPSAPQPSILSIPSRHPALHSLYISTPCGSCTLAILEWFICTPTRSTLIDWQLSTRLWRPSQHRISLLHRNLDYYAQIFGPSLRRALLDQAYWQRTNDVTSRIFLSSFAKLTYLDLRIDGTNWPGTADILLLLPAHLTILSIDVSYTGAVVDSDHLVKEDGVRKAMATNGLERLDPVLSRDNFKDLMRLSFQLSGYYDTLPSYRQSTLETIYQKLPTLHSRGGLDLELEFFYLDRPPPPSPSAGGGAEPVQLVA